MTTRNLWHLARLHSARRKTDAREVRCGDICHFLPRPIVASTREANSSRLWASISRRTELPSRISPFVSGAGIILRSTTPEPSSEIRRGIASAYIFLRNSSFGLASPPSPPRFHRSPPQRGSSFPCVLFPALCCGRSCLFPLYSRFTAEFAGRASLQRELSFGDARELLVFRVWGLRAKGVTKLKSGEREELRWTVGPGGWWFVRI